MDLTYFWRKEKRPYIYYLFLEHRLNAIFMQNDRSKIRRKIKTAEMPQPEKI